MKWLARGILVAVPLSTVALGVVVTNPGVPVGLRWLSLALLVYGTYCTIQILTRLGRRR